LQASGKVFGLLNVLDGDHAPQLEIAIDHQQLFDAMAMKQGQHLVAFGALLHSHQPIFAGHGGGDRHFQAGLKAQIATGDNAHQLFALHHRHAGDAVLAHEQQDLTDRGRGRHGDGLLDHTALEFLDGAHFAGLVRRAHALVDHADPAQLGQGDGEPRFGDRVHGR